MIINMASGGSASVKAVSYPSEAALPSAAKEGTIAIISAVSSGKVYVQNAEPAEPAEGMVWVTVADASNAPIQLGRVTLYPAIVRQYQNGAWVTVEAYVRSGGAWEVLQLRLFETGNPYTAVTGGWNGNSSVTTIEDGENLYLTVGTGSYNAAYVYTGQKIPAGKYKKLVATGKINYLCTFKISFTQTPGSDSANDITALWVPGYGSYSTDFETIELDLSTLAEDYEGYLQVALISCVDAKKETYAYVNEIYLTN